MLMVLRSFHMMLLLKSPKVPAAPGSGGRAAGDKGKFGPPMRKQSSTSQFKRPGCPQWEIFI